MLSIVFLVIASICNAIMDKVSHHYYTSIFSNFDQNFWDANISWKNKYKDRDPLKGRKKWIFGLNYPSQISDGWHLFKSIMILCLCSSIISYSPVIYPIIDLILYGIIWNLTFSLFYNSIFKKRNT